MISVIIPTYRPGGIDLLAKGFEGVDGDYELIVIDDYPGRVQRGLAEQYLRQRGIPLGYYGTSKPKTRPDAKGGLVNALNTALMHCRGDYIVSMSDYTILPTTWLAQWQYLQRTYSGKELVSGSAIMYGAPKPTITDDVMTWSDTTPALQPKWPWVPKVWETFYYGAPVHYFDSINGIDERADHCHCWPVTSNMVQALILGYQFVVEPMVTCHMIDHRVWDHPEEKTPWGIDGMWRIMHSQSLEKEPEWTVPSPNPFHLPTERRKALRG